MDSDDRMSEVLSTPAEINDRSMTPLSSIDSSDHERDEVDEDLNMALMRMRDDLSPPKLG